MDVGVNIAHTNEQPELLFLRHRIIPALDQVKKEQTPWRTPSVLIELNTQHGAEFIYPHSLPFEHKLDLDKLNALCHEFAVCLKVQTTPARNHLYVMFQ